MYAILSYKEAPTMTMRYSNPENQLKSTPNIIIDCFYNLVMNKDFKKLTVSEICEEAGISR